MFSLRFIEKAQDWAKIGAHDLRIMRRELYRNATTAALKPYHFHFSEPLLFLKS